MSCCLNLCGDQQFLCTCVKEKSFSGTCTAGGDVEIWDGGNFKNTSGTVCIKVDESCNPVGLYLNGQTTAVKTISAGECKCISQCPLNKIEVKWIASGAGTVSGKASFVVNYQCKSTCC